MAPNDRLPGLQALRLIAAGVVFTLHAIFWSARFSQPVVDFVFAYFHLGVQLFYTVSAFALMHSTRIYEDQKNWPVRFFIKRFFRIAPLYYVMIVVTLVHLKLMYGTEPNPTEVVTNVLFVNNFWPKYVAGIPFAGWSVSVEVLFYIMFPLLFVAFRTIWSGVILAIAAVLIGEVSRFYLDAIPGPIDPYGQFSIATNFRYFAFGILAYLIYARLRATPIGAPKAHIAIVLAYHAFFAALIAGLFVVILRFEGQLRPMHRLDMVLWGALFCIATVWLTVRRLDFLNWAPIQFLGERSYSLYLMHMIPIVYMQKPTAWVYHQFEPYMQVWALIPTVMMNWIVVVIVSSITYALIERPGMALGRQLERQLKRTPSAHPADAAAAPASGRL